MSGKPDYRNYINPGPKGSRFTAGWQAEFLPDGETYTEDKTGKVIEGLISSVRAGSIVRVRRLFCLGPWKGSPRKRREAVAERVGRILSIKGASIEETETGRSSKERGACAKMLMGAYEDIASAGRAIAKGRTGRPPKFNLTPEQWEIAGGIWYARKYTTDNDRLRAIERRLGVKIGRTTMRNRFGSPHGGVT